MSAENNNQKDGKNNQAQVNVVLDRSAELEALQKQLKDIEAESKKQRESAEKLAEEKKALEQEKTNLLSEKEQLEGDLKLIAEKEFNKKKTALMERVGKAFAPEDKRLKEIESKLNDPEKGPDNLKEVEYTMGILEEAMAKGKAEIEAIRKKDDDAKKAAEDAKKAGQAPPPPTGGETAQLNDAQQTGNGKKEEVGYDSYEAMISDFVIRARDTRDPAKQAEAEAILKELWKKWAKNVKSDFEKQTHASGTIVNQYESTDKTHHGVS